MPEPWQSTPRHILLNRIQPYTVIRIARMMTDGTIDPDLVSQPEKAHCQISQQYENITYAFIAYRTQRSILFCCTETNNILRAASSSEDAVFSMRTFTWSWWLPVSLCRSAIGLNAEPYSPCLGAKGSSTCLRSRHLHAVERYTRTMVFWTFFPLEPPHFDDWPRHLDRCHISVSSDHRIWWRSRWQVL